MSSDPQNISLVQEPTFVLPQSFEQLASNCNGDDSNWFGRTVTYITVGFHHITNLFLNAISNVTSSIPSFSSILRCIASCLLPDPRMRAAARRAANQNRTSNYNPFKSPLNFSQRLRTNLPLNNLLARPDHITNFVGKEDLKTIEITSSSSLTYGPLLCVLKSLSLNPHLETLLAVKESTQSDENIEKLKGHLLAIINFLRGDASQNITEDHLKTILHIFSRIDYDLSLCDSKSFQKRRANPEMLLLNLFDLFGATYDQVKDDLLELFESNIAKLKLLKPKDEPLGSVGTDSMAYLEEDSNKIHKELRAFLKKVALSDDFETLFSSVVDADELKTNAILEERVLHSKREIFRVNLKNFILALVQKIRKNIPDEIVTIDDQKALINLLILANSQNKNLDRDEFLNVIASYLGCKSPALIKLQKELLIEKLDFTKTLLNPPDELASVNESCIMQKLTNIGLTCYLDSALWMIARFESFNSILLSPLPESLSGPDLELAKALRQQLKGIVHELRCGNQVSPQSSHTLYQLLRVNGWPHRLSTMQDPQELLSFLFTKLLKNSAVTPFSFFTTERLSWQDPAFEHKSTKLTDCHEINYELQLGPKVKETRDGVISDPSMSCMKTIFDHNMVTNVPDYIPDETSQKKFAADKVTCFIGQAPKTLSILQKRYIPGLRLSDPGKRINGSISVFSSDDAGCITPSLTIPIYKSKDDLTLKENKTYKLKGVICHQGSTLTNGHYTFLSLQNISLDSHNPLNAWVKYCDLSQRSEPEVFLEGSSDIANLQNLVNTQGFYLIYEEDSSVALDGPADLFTAKSDEQESNPLFGSSNAIGNSETFDDSLLKNDLN
jgi:hypothetical protein